MIFSSPLPRLDLLNINKSPNADTYFSMIVAARPAQVTRAGYQRAGYQRADGAAPCCVYLTRVKGVTFAVSVRVRGDLQLYM